jgi:N-acetylmuramoyl-L-alanine amidase
VVVQMSRPYRRGDTGPAVAEVRSRLATLGLLPAQEDGVGDPDTAVFDEACDRAVRAFQQRRQITVDGLVGPETYRVLEEARWRLGDRVLAYSVTRPIRGDDVVTLQQSLRALGFDPGLLDGILGPDTEAAIRAFQRAQGLVEDGTCGPATFAALGTAGTPVEPAAAGDRTDPSVTAAPVHTVVLDPGHGGRDRGAEGFGMDEAGVAEDLAARVEGRLTATGVLVFLTRGADGELNGAARADFANATNADLFVSLHVDGQPGPLASGVATFYYGHDRLGRASSAGERLAGLVQRELVARTDLGDLGVWAKTWEELRRTRMPAVRVEVGYLTHPEDARRLASPEFRDTVAEAIAVAVRRLPLPDPEDPPTGQLSLADLPGRGPSG